MTSPTRASTGYRGNSTALRSLTSPDLQSSQRQYDTAKLRQTSPAYRASYVGTSPLRDTKESPKKTYQMFNAYVPEDVHVPLPPRQFVERYDVISKSNIADLREQLERELLSAKEELKGEGKRFSGQYKPG